MRTLDAAYVKGRPSLSEVEAAQLAKRWWGVGGTARERPSERDQVFEMSREGRVEGFLKIANALEARATLEGEATMLAALQAAQTCYGLPAWRPLAQPGGDPGGEPVGDGGGDRSDSTDGDAGAAAAGLVEHASGERRHLVRFVEPVGGVPMAVFRPRGPELRRQVGRLAGIFGRTLAAAGDAGADRQLVWDLRGAPELIAGHMGAIADPDRRRRVQRILDRHAAFVAPRAGDLRVGAAYNDLNPANIHVNPARLRDGAPHIVGVVDFGDALRTWTVAEAAVACAYAGLDTLDPVTAFCDVARGCAAEHALLEIEADVLYELARLRLALSVTVSAVRGRQEPDNAYLRVSEAPAWAALNRLDETHPDLARYRLREACGLTPCPRSARVASALRRASANAAPLLDPDPRAVPTVTLDLSLETGCDADLADSTDAAALTRRLFGDMDEAGAPIGIGRYDEARAWYGGEAFRQPGDDRSEWRTIHLGLDLFAAPGTPVRAPLPGRVVSAADNAGHLDYGPTIILEHETPDEAGRPVRFRTLFGHLSRASVARARKGERVEAGRVIGEIGDDTVNGGWSPHLHFQVIVDPLGFDDTFPGVAAPSERAVWTALSPDPNHLLGLSGETAAARPRPLAALVADRDRRLGPSLSLSYRRPLHIVRGRGTWLYDIDGQPFLDCVNNVAHVGHSHPRVNEAARRQMARLNTNTRYLHESILAYAERLAALFPSPLEVCFLVCSGTEANELALRMARTHTGKVGAVVLDGAYHGNSSSVVNLSPYKFNGPGGKGLRPWVRMAPMPDTFRGVYRGPAREAAPLYARRVGEAARALETEPTWFGDRPPGAAAFFHESIMSCGGQIPLPEGYLAAAYDAAREQGAVCVADEVQVGFGRVGSAWWAFEEHGVVPDIVTLGKPIGNGHPLAAVVTTRAIAESFANGMEYFNTFGGNPVSCEIGLAVLDVIEEEGLIENAAVAGRRLLEGFQALRVRHAVVGDARGRGLFAGIEFVREGRDDWEPAADLADAAVQRMRDLGVLLSTDGPDHNVLKLKPPLVFSEADADRVTEGLDRVLAETAFHVA